MTDHNYIYGHHPVTEAIRAGKPVEKVFFQQGERGEVEKEIRHLTKEYGIPLQVVPREKLNKMVKGQHQGVVAYLSLVEYVSLEDVVPFVFEQGEVPLLVLLDGVTDVRNFGAIARSAECAGAHAVVVPQSGSALANEEAMKASAGALARVRLCRVRSLFSATLADMTQPPVRAVPTRRMPPAVVVAKVASPAPRRALRPGRGT